MKCLILTSFFCALLATKASCFASLGGEDGGFNYDDGSGIGPKDWGNIRPEWAACRDGRAQSPIAIDDRSAIWNPELLGRLDIHHHRSDAVLRNRGHDIALEWPRGGGYMRLGDVKYTLKQLHWHSPSEHTIDGERFDLEMHMVHLSASGTIAVVGVLFSSGSQPDPFLRELTAALRDMALNHQIRNVTMGCQSPWNLRGLESYYRYDGSLTTPPCTEGVTWTVMKQIMSVTDSQLSLLRSAVDPGFERNARPLQPRHGRDVYRYCPWVSEGYSSF